MKLSHVLPLVGLLILAAIRPQFFTWIVADRLRLIIVILSVVIAFVWWIQSSGGEWRGGITGFLKQKESIVDPTKVDSTFENYEGMFGGKSRSGGDEHSLLRQKRESNYRDLVQHYYNLATDFYEYGWGESFHFGTRFVGEGFQESLRRMEYYLASKLELDDSQKVLDLGAGVGGPMRNIARFTGAKITGVNISEYQIRVGERHNKRQYLDHLCNFVQSDFMNLSAIPDESYDAAYTIEACCHSPYRVVVFREVFKKLKPGSLFAGYDWVMTDRYDSKNRKHVSVKEGIEVGNGLPNLATPKVVLDALKKAGFKIVEAKDVQEISNNPGEIPWYESLGGSLTIKGFRRTKLGRNMTTVLVTILESLRIAPKGTTKVQNLLNATADDLYDGGKLGIFTPSYYFLAQKPE